jgi:anti-sigma regulatory factor (Ser/Thr protein kinase)
MNGVDVTADPPVSAHVRALLPERLPPSAWCDGFALPDGRIALAIADVADGGPQAAALLAEVRRAMRAAALDPAPPAAILTAINNLVQEYGRAPMVAAIFGVIDPANAHVAYAASAVPASVPILRRALQRYAAGLGLDDDRRYALITAIGEAMANAVEHAYAGRPGVVRLSLCAAAEGLLVTIEDDGRWKPTTYSEERGRGLVLMRSLMDGVEITTGGAHTSIRLRLAWKRPGAFD